MKKVESYRHIVGLIIIAAICLMIVQNLGHIFNYGFTIYQAFMPLIYGVVIAFILNIIVNKYERYIFPNSSNKWLQKSRRPLSVIGAILSIWLMVGIVMYLAIPQTVHAVSMAVANLPEFYEQSTQWIIQMSRHIPYIDQTIVDQHIGNRQIYESISDYALKWGGSIVSTASNVVLFFFNMVIGFIFSLYILFNKEVLGEELENFFVAYVSEKRRGYIRHVAEVIYHCFSSFFVGQFLDALTLGIMMFVGLIVVGVPYAASIACVVGLTALIPIVGAWLGTIVGVLMVVMESPIYALLFLGVFLVMQQIENNFVYPKVVGNSIGLPGIWVFAAIIVGGNLYGVVGIFLGVPIGAVIYRLLSEDINKRLTEKALTKEVVSRDADVIAGGVLHHFGIISLYKKVKAWLND